MPIDKVIKFAPGESAMDHWFVRCLLDAKRRQATALLCILTSMHRRVRDDLSPILDGIFPRFGDARLPRLQTPWSNADFRRDSADG